MNKKSKCKTVYFEDPRLSALLKVPGSNPEMRYILKYLNTKYTEELLGKHSQITEILFKYESPMKDIAVLSFTWSE